MPRTRPARCLFRLSDAKVVIFHYTANGLQVFLSFRAFFLFFPLWGCCVGGVFLFFPCGLPLIIYMYTHARGRGCSMGATLHGLDGWRIEEGRRCWWSLQWSRGCQGRGPGIYAAQTGRGAGTAPVAWRRLSRAKWAFFVAK